jgi:chloramphenicol 3-O phosphotransferase
MLRNLIVITGSSGVGKSTLARALQERFLPDQWLHFSVDSIFYCLPRSIVERVDQFNEHDLVDSKAIAAASYAATCALLDLGHRVIFDAVVLTERGAERMMSELARFDPILVELTCSWDEIQTRTLARGDRTLAEAEHGYRHAGGHLKSHHTFDTTSTSATEVSRQLVAQLQAATSAA